MVRPEFGAAPDHNAIHLRHRALHEMPRGMDKRDVTTIDGQVYTVVYTTAQPTFTGVIGGYTTDTNTASSSSVRTLAAPAIASASATGTSAEYPQETQQAQQQTSATVSQDVAAATSTFSQVAGTSAASSSNNFSYGSSTGSTLSSTGTSDASNSSTPSDSAGLSTAGKAGLVVGVIFAIGVVLGLILLLLSKKKKQAKAEQARQDSEKNDAIAAGNASKSPTTAPRLSFRPASSFMPEFMGRPKSRLSQGNMLGATSSEGNAMKEKYLASSSAGQQAIPLTEKPAPAENPFKDPENPFADPVRPAPQPAAPQTPPKPVVMPTPAAAPAPIPMPEPAPAPVPVAMPSPVSTVSSDTVAAAAAGAGAVAAARSVMSNISTPRQSVHQQENAHRDSARQEPIEMPTPPIGVPAGLATPRSAVSDASHAGPPPESNVYRILMDFVPSMEDELELKAGQVVRMLHEYDDGWCLCTRLDHSQQGVVPRTCLAARPSKPRPAPGQGPRPMSPAMGPPGPNGRPMSPAMRQGPPPQGRPMSPGMGRPMSPANGPRGQRPMSPGPRGRPPPGMRPMSPGAYNQPPRPLSPGPRASKRSQSPGPYGSAGGPAPMAQQRPRSNSSSQVAREVRERRQTPPGPSPLGGAGLGLAL